METFQRVTYYFPNTFSFSFRLEELVNCYKVCHITKLNKIILKGMRNYGKNENSIKTSTEEITFTQKDWNLMKTNGQIVFYFTESKYQILFLLTRGGSSWRSGFGCWMVGACCAKAFSKSSIIKCLRFFTIFSNGAAPKHLNDDPSLPKSNYTPVMDFVWWNVSINLLLLLAKVYWLCRARVACAF